MSRQAPMGAIWSLCALSTIYISHLPGRLKTFRRKLKRGFDYAFFVVIVDHYREFCDCEGVHARRCVCICASVCRCASGCASVYVCVCVFVRVSGGLGWWQSRLVT